MQFKYFIKDFVQKAQELIKYLEGFKELSDSDKKAQLDKDMLNWSIKMLNYVQINALVKFVVKKGLEAYLPVFTQTIFDLIKTKIDGITK